MYKKMRHRLPAQGVMTLLAINAAVLVALTFINFGTRVSGPGGNAALWLDVPPGDGFLSRPWTLITYMVTQTDVWHAIFNMLWLYWFGSMFQTLTSPGRLVKLYAISGVAGAACYIAASLVWPSTGGAGLEGASAAVMGIVTATAFMIPDYRIRLFFIGDVKLKWVAVLTIILFTAGITGSHSGANIAHLGGVAAGAVYALWGRLRPRYRKQPGADRRESISEADARAELDTLLDKVRRSGYGSLTANERRRLFELSHRV